MDIIYKANPTILNDILKYDPHRFIKYTTETALLSKQKRTIMSIYYQTIERYLQEICINFLVKTKNFKLEDIIPAQDGFMTLIHLNYPELANECIQVIKKTYDFDMVLINKPFDEAYEIPAFITNKQKQIELKQQQLKEKEDNKKKLQDEKKQQQDENKVVKKQQQITKENEKKIQTEEKRKLKQQIYDDNKNKQEEKQQQKLNSVEVKQQIKENEKKFIVKFDANDLIEASLKTGTEVAFAKVFVELYGDEFKFEPTNKTYFTFTKNNALWSSDLGNAKIRLMLSNELQQKYNDKLIELSNFCLLYTSPSPRD